MCRDAERSRYTSANTEITEKIAESHGKVFLIIRVPPFVSVSTVLELFVGAGL
jgi:hypothetical protein